MSNFAPCSSSSSLPNNRQRLDDVISYFTLQAQHHLQQYQMYAYYAKYYSKYRRLVNRKERDVLDACTGTTNKRNEGILFTQYKCQFIFR